MLTKKAQRDIVKSVKVKLIAAKAELENSLIASYNENIRLCNMCLSGECSTDHFIKRSVVLASYRMEFFDACKKKGKIFKFE